MARILMRCAQVPRASRQSREARPYSGAERRGDH